MLGTLIPAVPHTVGKGSTTVGSAQFPLLFGSRRVTTAPSDALVASTPSSRSLAAVAASTGTLNPA